MDLYNKTMSWGYREGLKGIEKQIQKAIKKKRLVFLGENNVLYIYKTGEKKSLTFDEMVKVMIEVGGWQKQMETLGITEQGIKDILLKEYEKQKGAK